MLVEGDDCGCLHEMIDVCLVDIDYNIEIVIIQGLWGCI